MHTLKGNTSEKCSISGLVRIFLKHLYVRSPSFPNHFNSDLLGTTFSHDLCQQDCVGRGGQHLLKESLSYFVFPFKLLTPPAFGRLLAPKQQNGAAIKAKRFRRKLTDGSPLPPPPERSSVREGHENRNLGIQGQRKCESET